MIVSTAASAVSMTRTRLGAEEFGHHCADGYSEHVMEVQRWCSAVPGS